MNEDLKFYLKNTLINSSSIESRILHPINKIRYPKRTIYYQLERYTDGFLDKGLEPRFISLTGLRGVGKTTLLWQIADYIQKKSNEEIYFFNVNTLKNLGIGLHEALECFQKIIINKRFNELSEPIILLFDEVHDDENWSKTLKILYDEARTAFILCTGSSALMLNSTADLSRRMYTQKVFPFSFSELITALLTLKPTKNIDLPSPDLGPALKEILFYSDSAEDVIRGLNIIKFEITTLLEQEIFNVKDLKEKYIDFLNFPNLLFFQDEIAITNTILDLFKRIISEDIPKLNSKQRDFEKIEKLILRLAGSDEINPEKLAGIVGIKQQEIIELTELLAKAEILNLLFPFGGLDTKILKNRKAFFMSPSLRRALLTTLYGQHLPVQFKSKLVEDTVVMYIKRVLPESIVSYSSRKDQLNPDLIIETKENPILLEIGTKKSSLLQIKRSGIKYRYGLLVSNSVSTAELRDNVIHLPLIWFLLL